MDSWQEIIIIIFEFFNLSSHTQLKKNQNYHRYPCWLIILTLTEMEKAKCKCKTSFNKITHCIFDLDGTLLDTETAYMDVIAEILKERGKEYTLDARTKMIGRNTVDGWITAISLFNLQDSLEELLKEFQSKSVLAIKNCPLMPGVERLVRHLHKNNVPLAIATSSEQDKFVLKTQHLKEFFSLFHHAVTAGTDPEVKKGKPSPDVFLICASRFPDKPDPSKCLVFEDSPSGVEAACNAGMQCVWIPDPAMPLDLGKRATLFLKSLKEFQPETFGLQPF